MGGRKDGWMDGQMEGRNTHYVLGQYHVLDKYTLLLQNNPVKKVSRSSFYSGM